MSGSAATPKSGDRAKKQISEAKLWLLWVVVILVWAATSTAWGWRSGIDLASAASGATGATIGTILGLGAFYLVSRRVGNPGLLALLNGAAGSLLFPVTMSGLNGRPFTPSFVISSFTTVFVISIAVAVHGLLMRFRGGTESRRSRKGPPPQSDHLLYDAEVDGAT